MHRLVVWTLATLASAAAPAAAGTMLYATAATSDRLHGYCVGANGAMEATPRVDIATSGKFPTRLIASPDQRTVYAAENDRTEVYRVEANGGLTRLLHVPKPVERGVNSRDLALSPDGGTLYVPWRRADRIVTYPIGPDGVPTSQSFTSCAFAAAGRGFENLLLRTDTTPTPLLYVSSRGGNGAVIAYRVDPLTMQLVGSCIPIGGSCTTDEANTQGTCPSGQTCSAKTDGKCQGAIVDCIGPQACLSDVADPLGLQPTETVVSSERRRINGAGAMALIGNRLFVEARFAMHILGFDLDGNGNFFNVLKNGNEVPRQPAATKTKGKIRYQDLAVAGTTPDLSLLATMFVDGRVDAYRLKEETLANGTVAQKLPANPSRTTRKNVRTSPVRMHVRGSIAYVAAGQYDRVQAFRLRDDGLFRDKDPFSVTDTIPDSFPSDLVLVTVPDACN